jgi:hypothetical protein
MNSLKSFSNRTGKQFKVDWNGDNRYGEPWTVRVTRTA